jgi:hypothetical protein
MPTVSGSAGASSFSSANRSWSSTAARIAYRAEENTHNASSPPELEQDAVATLDPFTCDVRELGRVLRFDAVPLR